MSVCKYFLDGRCRYGDRCRLDHPRGGPNQGVQHQLFGGEGPGGGGGQRVTFRDSFGTSQHGQTSQNTSQYKWTAQANKQQKQTVGTPSADLVNSLQKEIEIWEQSKQWPFSCLSIDRELPCVPDFEDLSPEELRFEAYTAIKSGNIQTYVTKFQQLSQDYSNKRQQLKNADPQLKQKLIQFIDEHRNKTTPGMASFPTCVVCSTSFKYKGPKPHLLPCLHAVCSGCLGTHGNSTITCSVCQRSHDRINQSFPVDHVVLAEVLHLTAQHRPSEISCTNKEDGNQAVCWCEECSDFLCEHCQISHAEIKVTKVHKIWEMSDLSKTFKRSHSKCIRHGLLRNAFDTDCGHFICYQCLFTDHTNHAAITLEESFSLDNNLKEYVKSVSEKKDEVLQSTAAVDAHVNVLGDTSSRLRETVQHTFSELRALLDQQEKVILLELDQLMECMNTTNNNRRPVLKGIETSCQTTVDYINKCFLYTPPQQLHQLKSSIREATQFCNKSYVPKVHENEISVAFSKQGLQDLRSTISSFGSFLTPVGEKGQSDQFTSYNPLGPAGD